MRDLYMGMISGTSVDGVDCVIAEFSGGKACELLAANTWPYPADLRERIETLIRAPQTSLAALGALNTACGRFFADCARRQIAAAGLEPRDIAAIGHHGQTVFHEPDGLEPFTLQIGDPAVVAVQTGIATVADVRSVDVALGGQGAPMVPAFHRWLFAAADEPRVIVNIGGIANVTTLVPGTSPVGFDTGPGNTLMNYWIQRCDGAEFDRNGDWARSGAPIAALLEAMLGDSYFAKAPPKSTGRERFHGQWLDERLAAHTAAAAPADVQATLAELTAATIAAAVTQLQLADATLLVCGGGAHNRYLMERLAALHAGEVGTTAAAGLDPDWVEAAAFAWLARARLRGEAGNLPTVTGAREAAILGGLYSPFS